MALADCSIEGRRQLSRLLLRVSKQKKQEKDRNYYGQPRVTCHVPGASEQHISFLKHAAPRGGGRGAKSRLSSHSHMESTPTLPAGRSAPPRFALPLPAAEASEGHAQGRVSRVGEALVHLARVRRIEPTPVSFGLTRLKCGSRGARRGMRREGRSCVCVCGGSNVSRGRRESQG